MRNKMHYLLLILVMITLFGVLSISANATEFDLGIKAIDYSANFNVLQQSVDTPQGLSRANYENVQIEKYCYAGETFSLTAIIRPSIAYV